LCFFVLFVFVLFVHSFLLLSNIEKKPDHIAQQKNSRMNKRTAPPDIDFPSIAWAGGSSWRVSSRAFACSPTSPSSSSPSSSSSCLTEVSSASSRGKSIVRERIRREMFPCGHQNERKWQQMGEKIQDARKQTHDAKVRKNKLMSLEQISTCIMELVTLHSKRSATKDAWSPSS
jgi:hypothetical protein